MQKSVDLVTDLVAFARTLPTFDSHEHLVPETERLAGKVDFSKFVEMYVPIHMRSAGIPEPALHRLFHAQGVSEDEKFYIFAPWQKFISQSAYYRAAKTALKKFYGFDDITVDNYRDIGLVMRENNTPGLYRRVLKQGCGLGHIINQKEFINNQEGLFHCNEHIGFYQGPEYDDMMKNFAVQDVHIRVKDLESYKSALFQLYKNWDNQRFLAIKCGIVPMEIVPFDVEADTIIQSIVRKGSISSEDKNALTAWSINLFFNLARDSKRVFCFHTGPVIGSQDFRLISPEHIMPWALAYPDVKIDLYHMGYPDMQKAGLIVTGFPNVMLNLCWANVVAPTAVTQVVENLFDSLPINRIIGFGGDYSGCVENVYGALEMTRENLATALTRRITRGLMDTDEAKFILQRILVSNGEEWYDLEEE